MTTTNIKITLEISGRKYAVMADIADGSALSEITAAIATAASNILYIDATRDVSKDAPEEVESVPTFSYPDPLPYVIYFGGEANHRTAAWHKSFTNGFNELVEHRYEPRPEYTNDPERTE